MCAHVPRRCSTDAEQWSPARSSTRDPRARELSALSSQLSLSLVTLGRAPLQGTRGQAELSYARACSRPPSAPPSAPCAPRPKHRAKSREPHLAPSAPEPHSPGPNWRCPTLWSSPLPVCCVALCPCSLAAALEVQVGKVTRGLAAARVNSRPRATWRRRRITVRRPRRQPSQDTQFPQSHRALSRVCTSSYAGSGIVSPPAPGHEPRSPSHLAASRTALRRLRQHRALWAHLAASRTASSASASSEFCLIETPSWRVIVPSMPS